MIGDSLGSLRLRLRVGSTGFICTANSTDSRERYGDCNCSLLVGSDEPRTGGRFLELTRESQLARGR